MDVIIAIVLVVVGLFAAFLFIYFIVNMLISLTYTLKTMSAPTANVIGNPALTHKGRLALLPSFLLPFHSYSRDHGRVKYEEVGDLDPVMLLDLFEESVVKSGNKNLFFGRLKSLRGIDDDNISMAVGLRATLFTRFLAWVKIERFDSYFEWHLMFSEVRLLRTPDEERSHYEYGIHQHQHRESRSKEEAFGSLLWLLWDALFSNFTTRENARKAEWFERLISESWVDACRKV